MSSTSEPSARARRRIRDYLFLPSLVTAFERSYLQSMLRVASWFLVAHVPAMMAVAAMYDARAGSGEVSLPASARNLINPYRWLRV